MSTLQQIATQLLKTTQPNTSTLKQAQLQLQKSSRDDSFITTLLAIPQMQDISPQLARIATIYTLTYARNLVLWRNQAAINVAAQQMLDFMGKGAVDFRYRDQVGAALQYLVQKDQKNILVGAFVPNMIEMLKKAKDAPPGEINFQFITGMSEVLVDKVVPATGGQIQDYVEESFVCLCYLVVKILEYAHAYMTTNQEIVERALTLATKLLKILKKYLKKFIFFNSKLVQTLYTPYFHTLITHTLEFSLPENTLSSPLFYLNEKCKAPKLKQLFHCMKSIVIYLITQSLRIVIGGSGKGKGVQEFAVFKQCPVYINGFVNSVSALLEKMPYYKIKSKQVFKIIQEIYNFLIATLRTGKFYPTLSEIKPLALYSCLLKTLALSPSDYNNYYNDPQQFTNSIYQVIDLQASLLVNNEKTQMQDQNIDIEIFDSLKTHSANLLKVYVKYIDGTLAELMYYVFNVIQDKLNVQLSKNLMFFLVCILRDQVKLRSDFLYNLKKLVFKNLEDLEIPTKKIQEPYSNTHNNFVDVEYTLTLFVLERFLILFDELLDESGLIERAFGIAEVLLKNQKVEEVPKIIASEVIHTIMKTEQNSLYCRRTIQLLNSVMSAKKLNPRYLQSIQKIIKENDYVFKTDYLMLIEMCEKISSFLQFQIKKKDKDADIIGKLWHILEELVQSKDLGGLMADTVKRALQPLIGMIDGENQLELEEKVYKIMETMIKTSRKVGQYQIQILSILPKTFYSGKKKRSLSTCFSLLQLLIFYGRETLCLDPITPKNLILLCQQNITSKTVNEAPRSEPDCLEGVLILQSLITSIGEAFTQEMWITVISVIANKVKDQMFVYGFVKATLVVTLMLGLWRGVKFFGGGDCEELMKLIIKQCDCLNYYQPCKLAVIAFSNLLSTPSLPFISPRYAHILDLTITLLKHSITLKQLQKDQTRQPEDGQKQYNELQSKVINCYSQEDEFEYFKAVLGRVKEQDMGVLEAAVAELPEAKQRYLRELVNMRWVRDHARVIYKFKNKYDGRM